ncbi:MAG: TonB-dependent receptor [Muribaculaceae bacterium]|nr:TonB-dependent receptor [Muribaculaceae bacterium]
MNLRFFATAIIAVAAQYISAYKIDGKVIDKHTGEAVAYASVAVEGSQLATMTDENGCFTFNISGDRPQTIKVSMIGYDNSEVTVTPDGNETEVLTIELRENAVAMDELVVSANRNVVRRCEAPVVVSVLSNKLFETVNSTDLAQSLNYQSGLRVENNCQNCGFPQLRINGLEGAYSQVLINSRPVVSSLSGVYALEQMPVNMVERIEVVRGGGSALFGANAVGGTVNVITKEPINDHFEVTTDIENHNGKSWEENVAANATIVEPDGRYGIAFYESYRHRSPYDHDGDGFSEIGKLNANTLGFNAFYRFDQTKKINLEYHNTYEFRRGGNKFDLEPFQTDITEQTQHYINSGSLNYTQSWNDYKYRLNAYASAQHIDRNSYYGAQQNPDAYGKTTDITALGGATFSADFNKVVVSPATFTAGVEYHTNRLHDVMVGYGRDMRQNVSIFGTFIQNEWKLKHFTFLAGVRFDSHNLIDNPIISPRLNLLYRPTSAWQFRATWSTGFRAPQAYDEDLHVTAVGGEGVIIRLANGLKPERSNSFSGSIDRDVSLGEVDADFLIEGFYTELRDVFVLEMLGADEAGTVIKERRNGNGAKVYGANIDFKFDYTDYSCQLGFTAQKSRYNVAEAWSEDENIAPTRQMPRAPDLYGYFTLTARPLKRFECSVSGVYTGRMYVPHFAPTPEDIPADYEYEYPLTDILYHSPSFFELGLKASYTIPLSGKLRMQIAAGVKNLTGAFQKDLDKGGFRDSGYFYGPTQPRTYFVSLKFLTI